MTKLLNHWVTLLETDLFSSLKRDISVAMNQIISDVKSSASSSEMKSLIEQQGQIAVEEAEESLVKILDTAGDTLVHKQRKVSRMLLPHIRSKLSRAYTEAKQIQGKGSLRKRKVSPHQVLKGKELF